MNEPILWSLLSVVLEQRNKDAAGQTARRVIRATIWLKRLVKLKLWTCGRGR